MFLLLFDSIFLSFSRSPHEIRLSNALLGEGIWMTSWDQCEALNVLLDSNGRLKKFSIFSTS